MDLNRYTLTQEERFCLNHLKRRVKYEEGKFYYKEGARKSQNLIEIGTKESLNDYTSLLENVLPFVDARYFALNNKTIHINSDLISKLNTYLKYQPFSPKHMLPVKCSRPFPRRKVHYKKYPKIIADLPKMLAIVDGLRLSKSGKKRLKHSILSICYGTKFSQPHAVVTGTSSRGYEPNLRKIERNHLEPLRQIEPKEHFAIIARMLDMMGMKKEMRMKFEVPSWDQLNDTMKSYKTASGYVPWTNSDKKPPSKLYGVKYITEPHRAKKQDISSFCATYVLQNFKEVIELLESGNIPLKPFLGESFCLEEWKWEILNGLEAKTRTKYEEMHYKLRLFFVESAVYTLLSIILLRPIHKFLVGGPFGLALGINGGAFKALAREFLAQGYKPRKEYDQHLPRKDGKILDFIYDLYPELIPRITIELDISAFDQSLLYTILVAVALFYCAFYDYENDPLCQILMADVGFRLCVKFLHMVGIDKAYVVLGMMFSGKFETSTGNTIYQTYVFVAYIHHKMKHYADHTQIHLLYIAWQYNLINFKFQGDDLGGAYPRVLAELFNMTYDDYSKWCLMYGLIVKVGYGDKQILGRSYFYSSNGVWEEDESKHVDSVVFLKNQICITFEDDIEVGILPYRSTSDLVFRLGNSDKSSENIEGIYAKTLSIAMISLGNREAYEIANRLYDIIVAKTNIDYSRVSEQIEQMAKTSNALYQLSKEKDSYKTFPNLRGLRIRHMQELMPVPEVLHPFAKNLHFEMVENDS